VQWNPDALNDDPDVAEVSSRPSKPRPRWLVRAGIWVVVVAVAALVLWRLTADKATASLQDVRFVTKYAAEVDFVATNQTGDDLYVLPRVADRAGFEVVGMTIRGRYYDGSPTAIAVAERQTEAISMRVAVTDCVLAAGASRESELELTIVVGAYGGGRDAVPVGGTMPSWSSLLPPVCDDAPDRGIASVADVDLLTTQHGYAEVKVTVQNTGGRPISWVQRAQRLPTGRVSVRPAERSDTAKTLSPGRSTEFRVLVDREDCTTSGDGAAVVVLEFESGQKDPQRLPVELNESWTNLLGPCPAENGGDF
jgi:hypothetical protein